MLDANVLLDCLVAEADGQPRIGKDASDKVLSLCDSGIHSGLIAWHTLPIISYYHGRQNSPEDTAAMMDDLLSFLHVPEVAHADAVRWREHGVADFEDALQIAAAVRGVADVFVTRNVRDFRGCMMRVISPEEFLAEFL